jgi:hypothetical protein
MDEADPRQVFFLEREKLKSEGRFKIDLGKSLPIDRLYYQHMSKTKVVEEACKKHDDALHDG